LGKAVRKTNGGPPYHQVVAVLVAANAPATTVTTRADPTRRATAAPRVPVARGKFDEGGLILKRM